MDLRTGRTYRTREEALAAGVPESDLMRLEETVDGPRPARRRTKRPRIKFSKGSFKAVGPAAKR